MVKNAFIFAHLTENMEMAFIIAGGHNCTYLSFYFSQDDAGALFHIVDHLMVAASPLL